MRRYYVLIFFTILVAGLYFLSCVKDSGLVSRTDGGGTVVDKAQQLLADSRRYYESLYGSGSRSGELLFTPDWDNAQVCLSEGKAKEDGDHGLDHGHTDKWGNPEMFAHIGLPFVKVQLSVFGKGPKPDGRSGSGDGPGGMSHGGIPGDMYNCFVFGENDFKRLVTVQYFHDDKSTRDSFCGMMVLSVAYDDHVRIIQALYEEGKLTSHYASITQIPPFPGQQPQQHGSRGNDTGITVIAGVFACPEGLYFNDSIDACDFPPPNPQEFLYTHFSQVDFIRDGQVILTVRQGCLHGGSVTVRPDEDVCPVCGSWSHTNGECLEDIDWVLQYSDIIGGNQDINDPGGGGGQPGGGDPDDQGGGGSTTTPAANKIFKNLSSLTQEQRDKLNAMFDKMLETDMGKKLYDLLVEKFGNDAKFNIIYDPNAAASHFGIVNGVPTITLNSLDYSGLSFHELLHGLQAYSETAQSMQDARANIEIEAKVSEIIYMRELGDPSIDIKATYGGNDYDKACYGLSEMLDSEGNIKSGEEQNFNKRYNDALGAKEHWNYDSSRNFNSNFKTLHKILK